MTCPYVHYTPDMGGTAYCTLPCGHTALLPDCPTCGGTGWIPDAPRHAILPCPDCSDGKVTVAQLAATWQAVHGDERDLHMHDGFSLLECLRSVRPSPSPKEPA